MSPFSALHLSSDDLTRLEAALQLLLSPLDYDDVDAWRSAVNRRLKELLGADTVMFSMPVEGEKLLYYSDEYSPHRLKEYPTAVRPIAGKYSMWEKARQLKIFNRDMLWRPHLDTYYRSAYYNEYIVPSRGYDMLGMTTSSERAGIKEEKNPTLLFHHDHPGEPQFGERGAMLLRLLYPTFQAGVENCLRFTQEQQVLLRCLDQMKEGLLLCDLAGRVLHQNPVLTELLQNEPERYRLEQATRKIARSLIQLSKNPGKTRQDLICVPAIAGIKTQGAAYEISGNYVGGTEMDHKSYVLITLERLGEELPSEEMLRGRFGLTGREAKVALLLARRRTSKEIAGELFISPHTTRHHVENVLDKLDIHSRTKVKEVLMSAHLS